LFDIQSPFFQQWNKLIRIRTPPHHLFFTTTSSSFQNPIPSYTKSYYKTNISKPSFLSMASTCLRRTYNYTKHCLRRCIVVELKCIVVELRFIVPPERFGYSTLRVILLAQFSICLRGRYIFSLIINCLRRSFYCFKPLASSPNTPTSCCWRLIGTGV
jgi:hypothetical protein